MSLIPQMSSLLILLQKRAVLRQAGLDAVPPLAAYIIDASLWFIVPWWRANFG